MYTLCDVHHSEFRVSKSYISQANEAESDYYKLSIIGGTIKKLIRIKHPKLKLINRNPQSLYLVDIIRQMYNSNKFGSPAYITIHLRPRRQEDIIINICIYGTMKEMQMMEFGHTVIKTQLTKEWSNAYGINYIIQWIGMKSN